jgi:hypothetical protein
MARPGRAKGAPHDRQHPGTAPRDRHRRGSAAERRLLRARDGPAARQAHRQLRSARQLPPLLRRHRGPARIAPHLLPVEGRARRPDRRGPVHVHRVLRARREPRLVGGAPAPRGGRLVDRVHRIRGGAPRAPRPGWAADRPRRLLGRRPARPVGLGRRARRARDPRPALLGAHRAGSGGHRLRPHRRPGPPSRGRARRPLPLRRGRRRARRDRRPGRRPGCAAGPDGRRHRAPRRLPGARPRPPAGLARRAGGSRPPGDADPRPAVLHLRLLPRARRRAVRDRDGHPRLRHRRAAARARLQPRHGRRRAAATSRADIEAAVPPLRLPDEEQPEAADAGSAA